MVFHQHGGATLVIVSRSIFNSLRRSYCRDRVAIGATYESYPIILSVGFVGTCKGTLRHVRTLTVKTGSDIRKCNSLRYLHSSDDVGSPSRTLPNSY